MRYNIDMELFSLIAPYFFAGVCATAVGFIWYHPSVFGKAWMRISDITPESAERQSKRKPLMAFVGMLAAMWMAYVMSFVLIAFQVYDVFGGLEVAFWLWAGFVAPTMLGVVLWEGKSVRLYLLNALYWLVALIVISAVLTISAGVLTASPVGVYDGSAQVTE